MSDIVSKTCINSISDLSCKAYEGRSRLRKLLTHCTYNSVFPVTFSFLLLVCALSFFFFFFHFYFFCVLRDKHVLLSSLVVFCLECNFFVFLNLYPSSGDLLFSSARYINITVQIDYVY